MIKNLADNQKWFEFLHSYKLAYMKIGFEQRIVRAGQLSRFKCIMPANTESVSFCNKKQKVCRVCNTLIRQKLAP